MVGVMCLGKCVEINAYRAAFANSFCEYSMSMRDDGTLLTSCQLDSAAGLRLLFP